jgi:PAS domain S-box-containing protein
MIDTLDLISDLRATLGKLELALDTISEAIAWTGKEGKVQWCNNAMATLVQRNRLFVLGQRLVDLLPVEKQGLLLTDVEHPVSRTLRTGSRITGTYEFRKGSERVYLEISGTPVSSEQARVIFMIRDITLQKQAEEALQLANKELESFCYSVSHDLRTPLRAIDGFSKELLDNTLARLDDRGKKDLSRIRKAAQRMAQLIEDLLNLSRVSRSEIVSQSVDLSAQVQKVVQELKEAYPERQVEWVITPKAVVSGDAQLLQIMLDNLIRNAWKFTGKKAAARIEFGVSRLGGKITYFVRDNGAGFNMTYANKLFGVFQRLHDAEDFPGTGIGLATVQRIIQRHRGTLWVEAQENQGATFYFSLP